MAVVTETLSIPASTGSPALESHKEFIPLGTLMCAAEAETEGRM